MVCLSQAEVGRWRNRAEAADGAARKVEGRAAAAEAAAAGALRDARAAQEQVLASFGLASSTLDLRSNGSWGP